MAIIIRSYVMPNAKDTHFVKVHSDPKQLLATIQSNVGSRLVYEAHMNVVDGKGVAFMVLVDTNEDNLEKWRAERLPITIKVANFLDNVFKN